MAIYAARETGFGIKPNSFLTIRVDEYASMFSLDAKNSYKQLKNAVETLYQRSVRLHDIHPESGKERVLDVRWVSSVAYIEGEGLVQMKFGDDIVPFITLLEKGFTSYKIQSIAKMTSTYAIRLYELLMQWEKIGKRQVSLEELKHMLQVEGQYVALKDFKKYVLDLAIFQINKFSELQVSYENVKTGRLVTGFVFYFGLKPDDVAKKRTSKPLKKAKLSLSSFAGLELIMFNQLKKTYPNITQAIICDIANNESSEPLQVMQRITDEIGKVDEYGLK